MQNACAKGEGHFSASYSESKKPGRRSVLLAVHIFAEGCVAANFARIHEI